MLGFVVAMYGLAWIAKNKIHNNEDYVVAGRRLPLSLAWMTLLATWFGAGTLLTATDEVRQRGIVAAALDPFGAGCCLLLAGLWIAGPLWRMKLLTLCDLFRLRYGRGAELCASLLTVPSYFGWIAAQFYAVAGMLQLFFGLPPEWGLPLVAIVGTGYTLLGGMWSVTLTDAVQVSLLLLGLLVLGASVLLHLGQGSLPAGFSELLMQTPAAKLQPIPYESLAALIGWLGVFAVGSLGNLPAQDLVQRIFASRTEQIAQRACLVAGLLYLLFGMIPIGLGLASALLFPDGDQQGTLPLLAQAFLSPPMAVIFTLVILSAVMSTIDSAILAPASVLAQNVLPRLSSSRPLLLNRLAVLGVGACSLLVALAGEDAYALLEQSYSLTLVSLFVPMIFGIYTRPKRRVAGLVSMLAGTAVWLAHFAAGWDNFLQGLPRMGDLGLPVALVATGISCVAYLLLEPPWRMDWHRGGYTEVSDCNSPNQSLS